MLPKRLLLIIALFRIFPLRQRLWLIKKVGDIGAKIKGQNVRNP